MTFIACVGFITALISGFMVLMILLTEKKNTINLLLLEDFFSLLALGITVFFAGGINPDAHTVFNLWNVTYFGLIILPVVIFYITLTILGEQGLSQKKYLPLYYVIVGLLLILHAFGLIIPGVIERPGGYLDANLETPGGFLAIIFIMGGIGYAMSYGFHSLKNVSPLQRKQFITFVVSLFFGLLGGVGFYLPTFGINDYQWVTLFLPGAPAVTGYAVLRLQLFDTGSVTLRVFRLLNSMLFAFILLAGCIWMIFGWETLKNIVDLRLTILYLFSSVIWFIVYQMDFVKDLFSPYDRRILKEAVHGFLADTQVPDTIDDVDRLLTSYFTRFLESDDLTLYDRISIKKYPKLMEYFSHNYLPLVVSSRLYQEYAGEIPGELLYPLYGNNKQLIGIIVFGKKKSGTPYMQEDIDMISQILIKVSLALQILDHNLNLRIDVLTRTHELTEKNEELARAYESLKEVDANKDTFLAIASHELRTPMTIIKGYSDMLIRGSFGELNTSQKKYMSQIYTSTEDLISFVNNILDISKLEAGRMTFAMESIDPHIHIQKIYDNFSTLYTEKSITLVLTDHSKRATMSTDPTKLTLILNNLLSNAYKFTTSGGQVDIILEDIEREGVDYFSLTVRYTGMGMSIETQEHIFEKFSQSTNQDYTKKSIQGSGLGLHLIREVIHHLGGEISVTSTQNIGTTFIVVLPLILPAS